MAGGRKLRTWHRRLGIVVAFFALLLSITGILLNHEATLNLNTIEVKSSLLLSLYGMEGAGLETRGFELGDDWLVAHERSVYLGAKTLGPINENVIGAIVVNGVVVLTTERQVALYSTEGELIERYAPTDVSGFFEKVGRKADRPVLRTSDGLFVSDTEMVSWKPVRQEDTGEVIWAEARPLPGAVRDTLNRELRGGGLPLHRILLDLHSGRILSEVGRLAMDAAALLLILLSLTGLWIWWPRN